ncbi:MAG: DUF4377 domain-containing protein [Idiomarina sp.]
MELKTLARYLSLALMTTHLFGCGSSDDSTEYTVTVAPQPVYYGLGLQFTPALVAIATREDGQTMFASRIAGFEHEFGVSYELRVLERKVDTEGYADASSVSIELIEIISSTTDPVGTSYVYNEVELSGNPFIDKNAGVYGFYQYEFLCAEGVDCDGLVAIGDSGVVRPDFSRHLLPA